MNLIIASVAFVLGCMTGLVLPAFVLWRGMTDGEMNEMVDPLGRNYY
ncbi:MAG: hypothetical protein Q4F21_09305 [Lachnospiraceae bacterium]|nr:hypothetical protein [Lachnospiraceae bacterium]